MARLARLVSILVLAAGCGKSSTSPPPPAPPPPPPPSPTAYTCLGQPLPTSAVDPLVVSGIVRYSATSPTVLAGATLTAYRTGNATALATTTSGGDGSYSMSIATGATPLDGYVRVTKPTYLDLYAYPPVPLVANSTQNLLVLTATELALLGNLVGVTQTSGKGFIAVAVSDCDGAAVAGATVSTNPAGTVRYNGTSGPSSTATKTASDGVAYVFNVTAGDVVVNADSGSKTLRAHTVNARADVVTLTAVRPGP